MQWSWVANVSTQELWFAQDTTIISWNTTCPVAAWIWSPCLWIRRKEYKTKYMHKTLVFPLQNQAVHIASSFHVNLHLQPDSKLELSSNQAWLNLEDFFPTGEPFLLSCSKHDFVLSVFPPPPFFFNFYFRNSFIIIIIMNKLVLNQFQQLELIFLLLTLHLGLSQSGRLSISINITESSGICINVLLTSWQSFGTRSWDLRSKGKKRLYYTLHWLDCKKLSGKTSGFFAYCKNMGQSIHSYPLISRCIYLTILKSPCCWLLASDRTCSWLEQAVLLLFSGRGTRRRTAEVLRCKIFLQSF